MVEPKVMDDCRSLNSLPNPLMMCGEDDRLGRPAMPFDQWMTHCRILRNQELLIAKCTHPVSYRGLIFYQVCPDDCAIVRKYAPRKEKK